MRPDIPYRLMGRILPLKEVGYECHLYVLIKNRPNL
jgi:hypothetical protein